jgi:DNA-binding CsgD family transcriptional regulator
MGNGGGKRTAIGPQSTLGTILGDALHRPGSHGLRFRWGITNLVLFSIPLEEHAPAPAAFDQVAKTLSPAEGAVIELASRGYSNAEIAKRRTTAISTTKKQLESAYRKLGVGSRAELVSLLARGQRRTG